MTYTLTLKNVDTKFIKHIESLVTLLNSDIKIEKEKSGKKPSKRVLDAIQEVEKGEVTLCKDFADFKKKVLQ